MTKLQFLTALRYKLSGIAQDDAEERLSFYTEMIEDRMEEGLSEEDAVASIGSVEELSAQILADFPSEKSEQIVTPNSRSFKQKTRLKVWVIILLVLGSPIWLSLAISAFAVLLSLVICLWAAIISLWAVFASLVGCALGCLIGGIVLAALGNGLSGIAVIGGALVCAGISILWFLGCKVATKGVARLTKNATLWIKNCFAKKEEA